MPNLLLVMIGGAAGAGLRWEFGRLALARFGPGFPWGTLGVNLIGGLLIGVLAGAMIGPGSADRPLWLLLAVGLLGGFTTFSAFSLDLFAMLERGRAGAAALYAAASVLGSLLLLGLGWLAARAAA
ncbi:MAG TPA: fluoride efflux transporter CrcB [Allosphingosinicella sp.]|jgi:CrcB protein|nr:fluoride efflux transporter CrcB [Allosphingosinicella sp.]